MEKKEYKHNTTQNSLVTNIDYKGETLNLITRRDENKPHIFNHTIYHSKSGMTFKPRYYTELPEIKTEVLSEEQLEQIIHNHNKTYNIILKALPKIKF